MLQLISQMQTLLAELGQIASRINGEMPGWEARAAELDKTVEAVGRAEEKLAAKQREYVELNQRWALIAEKLDGMESILKGMRQ